MNDGPAAPAVSRLLALRRRLSPDAWAMMAIAAVVVAANLVYLLDLSDPNPLGPRSALLAGPPVPGPTGGRLTIDPNNGFVSQALGHRAALDLVHLRLPWWNPYEGSGAPLAGEMQSAALFAPTLLTLLSNGQLYEHMLLEMIAGIATFLLLRRLAINRWASTAAGIAFALNGTFAWLSNAAVNPVAFLPLLLLGIELAYAATIAGRAGGWWLVAVAGALSFYAGFPETAYIDALLALCWFGWRCGCVGTERLRAFLAKGAAGGVVGTLLAAPLLIAAVDYVNHGDLGVNATGGLGTTALPVNALPQLLLPYVYGPIFDFADPGGTLPIIWSNVGGYLTVTVLLLALVGLFSARRRGLRLVLLVWTVLVFARMYNVPHLLWGVLGVLPGMSHVAFFRYATPALELSVIILAALGLDDLARAPGRRRRLLWGYLAMLMLVGLAVLEARTITTHLGARFSSRPYFALGIAWGVLAPGVAVPVAFRAAPRRRVPLIALWLAVDALAMFVVPEAAAPRAVAVDNAPAAFLKRHLGNARFFTLGPLAPNYGSYFGLASLNINDIPIPKPFERYVYDRLDQVVDPTKFVGSGDGRNLFAPAPEQELMRNLGGYRQAGVAYVLTPAGMALPQSPATFTLAFRSSSTWVYRLADAEPYFTTSNRACTVSPDGRESVRLTCPSRTVLVRRETDLPGWSATVDGRPVRVTRADGLFQAVTAGAGSHRIQFSYAPPGIGWGYLAFAAGCAPLLLAAARRRRGVGHALRPAPRAQSGTPTRAIT